MSSSAGDAAAAASADDTADSGLNSLDALLARLDSARAASGERAGLDSIPDAGLFEVLRCLPPADLRSAARVNARWRDVASDDRLFSALLRARHPDAVDYVSSAPALAGASWRARARAWASVAARWAGRAPPDGRPIRRYTSRAGGAGAGAGAVFCVCALGGGAFLTGGGEGVVRVHALGLDGASAAGADAAAAGGGGGGGAAEADGAPPAAAASAKRGGVRLLAKAEFTPPDGESGMLGMSVDHDGAGAAGATAVTGHFSGAVRLWRVAWGELSALSALPVKRLKAILSERKIPIDGLRERHELVARVRAFSALPLLSRLAATAGHHATVVSTSHYGDLAATGSNDGSAALWRLGLHDAGAAGSRVALLTDDASLRHGVDAVFYDARFGALLTGDKGGGVTLFDLAAPGGAPAPVVKFNAARGSASGDRGAWVWCVRSASTWASASGAEPGRPPPRGAAPHTDWGAGLSEHERDRAFAPPPPARAELPPWLEDALAAVAEGEDDEDDEEMGSGGGGGGGGIGGPSTEAGRDAAFARARAARGSLGGPRGGAPGGGGPEAGHVTAAGDGRHILSGGTDGWVCLWDTRAGGGGGGGGRGGGGFSGARPAAQFRLPAPPVDSGFGGCAVSGMSAMFGAGRFVTSSFDGVARVWDVRTLRPVLELPYAGAGRAAWRGGDVRLARCEVTPDLVVAGAMDGVVVAWDMWPDGRVGEASS